MCVRACVRACVRVRVRACVCVRACVYVSVKLLLSVYSLYMFYACVVMVCATHLYTSYLIQIDTADGNDTLMMAC